MKTLNRQLITAAVLTTAFTLSGPLFAGAKDQVPDDARGMANPVEADADVLKAAKKIYKKRCKKCHGKKGNGKGPGAKDMDPAPTDWTKGIDLTEGEQYWLIMNGSKDTEMKGWKAGLAKKGKEVSEEEAWGLVHYIRKFGE